MKDKRNIIILALLLVMVVMSYGFVSYSTKAIESSRSNEIRKWDVAITNVETLINGEALAGETKYSEGILTVNPVLYSAEDSIEYRVTITNNGLIDAKLTDTVYSIKDSKSMVVFTYDKSAKEIKSKESITVIIRASVDREQYIEPTTMTNELNAMFNYVQA